MVLAPEEESAPYPRAAGPLSSFLKLTRLDSQLGFSLPHLAALEAPLRSLFQGRRALRALRTSVGSRLVRHHPQPFNPGKVLKLAVLSPFDEMVLRVTVGELLTCLLKLLSCGHHVTILIRDL